MVLNDEVRAPLHLIAGAAARIYLALLVAGAR
jgi:hypothetical protein